MYFNIRLLELIKYLGENPNSFGKKLKASTGENIRLLTKNENANPSLDILSEIVTLYPNINSRWFLTGEGEMLLTEGEEQKQYAADEKHNISNEPKITVYSCQDCISKQKEIDALKIAIDALKETNQMLHYCLGNKDQQSASG